MDNITYSDAKRIESTICSTSRDFLFDLQRSFNRKNYQSIYWYLGYVNDHVDTKVSISRNWWSTDFTIDLNTRIIQRYSEEADISIMAATKAILSHEILHILLNHFSTKYDGYNKRLLNIAGDLEINQIINLGKPFLQIEDFDFKPFRDTEYYYKCLLEKYEEKKSTPSTINIESELSDGESQDNDQENNNQSGISQDTSRDDMSDNELTESNADTREDEEIDTDLDDNDDESNGINNNDDDSIDEDNNDSKDDNNSEESYNNDNNEFDDAKDCEDYSKPDTAENISEDLSESQSANPRGEYERSTNDSSDISDIIEDLLPDNSYINTETVNEMETSTIDTTFSIEDVAKVEEKIKRDLLEEYSIKGLKDIVRQIARKERAVKITPHGREYTYKKFNNRRKSDVILPGKKYTNEGVQKKFDSSPIVFIDISGSTSSGRINSNLMNVACTLHDIGATIVYYDNQIKSICEPDTMFYTESPRGGTQIANSIEQYVRHIGKFDRAYVFTDGYDDFTTLRDVCDKFNVYFITENEVFEQYTEKSKNLSSYLW